MIADLFYVLNYPAWAIFFGIFMGLLATVMLQIKIEIKYIKVAAVILTIVISVIAFNYVPSKYADLSRLFKTLDYMRATNGNFYNQYEFVSRILFKLVSKTQNNSWLPFISTLIRLVVFFSILFKYIDCYDFKSLPTRIYVMYFLAFFPLFESISGVRYYLAIVFIYAGISYGLSFKKQIYEIIYILLGLFTHIGSIVFVVFRFLIIDVVYKYIRPFRWLLVIWTLALEQILFLLKFLNIGFINSVANSLTVYSEEVREISRNLIIARFSLLIILLIMFYSLKKMEPEVINSNNKYYRYLELILLYSVGSIQYPVLFQRSIFFVSLISMVLVIHYFSSEKINRFLQGFIFIIFIVLSLGMIANQIYGLIVGYF